MLKKLRWEAFSGKDRNKTIEAIKNTIVNNDGSIMNFNLFSDLALSLSIEIEENQIQELHRELSTILTLSELRLPDLNLKSKKECLIFMNVSFSKGEGNLKNEIPDVPG